MSEPEDDVSLNWQGAGATKEHPGNGENCITNRRSPEAAATRLKALSGSATPATSASPATCNGLNTVQKLEIDRMRRLRQRGYLPSLPDIDFLLDLIREKFGV